MCFSCKHKRTRTSVYGPLTVYMNGPKHVWLASYLLLTVCGMAPKTYWLCAKCAHQASPAFRHYSPVKKIRKIIIALRMSQKEKKTNDRCFYVLLCASMCFSTAQRCTLRESPFFLPLPPFFSTSHSGKDETERMETESKIKAVHLDRFNSSYAHRFAPSSLPTSRAASIVQPLPGHNQAVKSSFPT